MSSDWGFTNDSDEYISPFAGVTTYQNGDEALKAIFRLVQGRIAANDMFKGVADRQAVIEQVAAQIIDDYNLNAASQRKAPLTLKREEIFRYLADKIIGWGPLAELMKDQRVEDIIILRPDLVVVFYAGALGWQVAPVAFDDWEDIRQLVNNKVDHRGTGRSISEAQPQLDAQLEDGSRLHAIMRPLTVPAGPVVTIRRFRPIAKRLEDLVNLGHMTDGAALFLRAMMKAKMSAAIVGGTGSGKTTVGNGLLAECGPTERIITCEDTPELQIGVPFWTQLTVKRPNQTTGDDGVDMAALVKETLRMRPDRIIIGEARGPEMGAILQAGNTGHDGILFTVHSNDPWAAIQRMETLALMDKTLSTVPIYNLRLMITTALQYIIHVSQIMVQGERTRRLMSVTELQGMNGQNIGQEEILRYDPQRGVAVWTGSYPHPERLARLEEAWPDFNFERDVARRTA